ncbi:MAG: S9 family peptidase, partial [Rariglobus sp.]
RIWVLPISGGEPFAITPPLRGVTAPLWAPDGNRLLFSAVVTAPEIRSALEKEKSPLAALALPWPNERPGPPSDPVKTAEKPAPDAKKPADSKAPPPPPKPSPDGNLAARRAWLALNETRNNPALTHRLDLNAGLAGEGELEFTHLFIVERAGAAPVDITPGFVSYTHAAWLPDSASIVCSGPASANTHPDRGLKNQLFILKADGKELRPLASSDEFSLDHPVVSRDGKLVACTAQPAKNPADLSYGQTRVATVDVADGKLKIVTAKFDRSAQSPAWSTDGKFIYFTAETSGNVPLHRVPVAGGNAERITSTDTWTGGFSVGDNDVVFVSARAANPGELYRTRLNGRDSRILTAHNSEWLRDKKVAAPERRKLKQPDGTEIEYWVVKPPYLEGGFHYPLLVLVHGGPGSMWGPGTPSIWHDVQFFAARGYGVIFANFRGSSGYGEKFQRASFQQWATGPSSDVLATADAVAKENWVDRDRQVILGGSYGGYLTAWIVSIDQRFKAAVAARGVYDLTTFLGQGDAWPLVPWHFGGYPWQPEIRKLLDAQSPLTRVESIRTPLLIKQNDADHQTGAAQGELLYRSLKVLGRPVEFVRYPRASHNLSRTGDPDQRIDRLVRFDEFFQRFIDTPAQPVPLPPIVPTPPAPMSAPTPTPPPKPTAPLAPAKPEEKPADSMMGGSMEMMSGGK